MWIVFLVVIAGIVFFLFKRTIDNETKKNISFLVKILLAIGGLIVLLAILINVGQT